MLITHKVVKRFVSTKERVIKKIKNANADMSNENYVKS